MYSSTLMLTLLKQSRGTPCLFAVVMPHTGFVILEEMTDAELSLSWDFGLMSRAGGVSDKKRQIEQQEAADIEGDDDEVE